MARSINALYDTRPEAEVAKARLAAEAGVEDVRILGKGSAEDLGKLDLSDPDRKRYAEGLASGASLLTAKVGGREDEAKIIKILAQAAAPTAGAAGATQQVAQARIPLVEEELRIGKREVVSGGARVNTRVSEVPAEAQVTLKQERLEVDRRPASRTMSDADVVAGGLLKRRVIEISEMREEPVITKEAFVREEIVIHKTVEERTETIHDTVRRTEVDVEELHGGGPAASRTASS
jgi:uncharacterized protein (TIGR02271 family)